LRLLLRLPLKILLVTSRYPWPPRRGDQIRAVQALDFLSAEHEVTLLTPAPGKEQAPPPAGAAYRVETYRPARLAALALVLTRNLPLQNADAVTWWLREVWPAVRQALPAARVIIAGDRPTPSLRRAIARAGAQLIESPPDMRSIIAQATLSLAPMRCGSGVPIKVLEAWAAGTPIVATPWAVAGTSGRQGEDFRTVGTHPIEWVSAIRELLDDPDARQHLAESGRRRLAADYSREVVRDQLLDAVRALGL